MDAPATEVFLRFFTGLSDPRRHNAVHRFTDLLTIAILAVLCKSDDWAEVVEWARAQRAWLARFLELPRGIPCADTFRRLFARLDPLAFERCFVGWTRALADATAGRVVAVDGKSLRQSFRHAWDRQGAIHLVSAWCAQNQLVLGQLACDGKSNEITALPKLLALLDLKGAIVTIDAMGCQRAIAAQVLHQQADYVLAVKDNQPTLHAKVQALMQDLALGRAKGEEGLCDYHQQSERRHGRIETRRVWVTDQVQWLGAELPGQWPGLGSVAMVECVRQDLGDFSGKVSVERRYFISSLTGQDAGRLGRAVRQHWGVENRLHWRLDMSFGEDRSRLRTGHGAENFSRLRRIVINQLKADPRKVSLKVKRYRCSIDRNYLLDILRK